MRNVKNLVLAIPIASAILFFFTAKPMLAVVYERIYGSDRYQTSVAVYKKFFDTSSPEVFVLAAGYGTTPAECSPDALCAAPLAAYLKAPIFLTHKEKLTLSVCEVIKQSSFKRAIIVGGRGAVSETIAETLRGMGIKVRRIDGADRYHTSALIAQELFIISGKNPDRAFVVSGENFADAVSSSFLAAFLQQPILLTKKDLVPFATKAALNSLNIQKTTIVGGYGAVSLNVERSLPNPQRIAGLNRYETSIRICRTALNTYGFSRSTVFLASGENFADALSASPVAALLKSCVVLVPPDASGQEILKNFLFDEIGATNLYLIGGPSALSFSIN